MVHNDEVREVRARSPVSSSRVRGIRAKQSVTSIIVIASPTGRSNLESIIRLYLSDWTASFVTKLAVTILIPLHLDHHAFACDDDCLNRALLCGSVSAKLFIFILTLWLNLDCFARSAVSQ